MESKNECVCCAGGGEAVDSAALAKCTSDFRTDPVSLIILLSYDTRWGRSNHKSARNKADLRRSCMDAGAR